MDAATLIRDLAVPHRAKHAWRQLLAMRETALPAVEAALHDPNPDIRYFCVRYLDHFPSSDAIGDLIALARDADPRVRTEAFHALACDRCKPDKCAPDVTQTTPVAVDAVRGDPSHHVRQMALEVLGKAAHSSALAANAIREAMTSDPSPAVRKKAAWYAPGGAIHTRTAPKAARRA